MSTEAAREGEDADRSVGQGEAGRRTFTEGEVEALVGWMTARLRGRAEMNARTGISYNQGRMYGEALVCAAKSDAYDLATEDVRSIYEDWRKQ